MARPTVLTQELSDELCKRLAECGSLRAVCRSLDMPTDNRVRVWVLENEQFAKAYARAKSLGIDAMVEETLEIADTPLMGDETTTKADGSVEVRTGDMLGHRKVQIETRRWLAERLEPRKYGARTGLDLTNSDGTMSLDSTARASRTAALLKLAEARKTMAEVNIDDLV